MLGAGEHLGCEIRRLASLHSGFGAMQLARRLAINAPSIITPTAVLTSRLCRNAIVSCDSAHRSRRSSAVVMSATSIPATT
jgi:hypothetical protein